MQRGESVIAEGRRQCRVVRQQGLQPRHIAQGRSLEDVEFTGGVAQHFNNLHSELVAGLQQRGDPRLIAGVRQPQHQRR